MMFGLSQRRRYVSDSQKDVLLRPNSEWIFQSLASIKQEIDKKECPFWCVDRYTRESCTKMVENGILHNMGPLRLFNE